MPMTEELSWHFSKGNCMELKEKIKLFALNNNIDKIGFCNAEPFYNVRKILLERAEKGFLSGFEEKDIEKRINPKLTMTNVKSIIMIAESYNKKCDFKVDDKLRGEISISAVGKDYHTILKEKLNILGEYIKKIEPEAEYMIFADTGPLVDREVAKRAGIGWQGKNGAIITEEFGSWVFLGYMLLNVEIPSDEPMEKDCGECRRCILACPTSALRDNFEFCATECVSFLTQTKENIPYEKTLKMGKQIYGCDVCQKVCPYNKNGIIKEIIKDIDMVKPDLEEILNISNAEFKKRFGVTSAGWRGKKVLQRNAVIALGNIKDIRAVKILKKCLEDERGEIKFAAQQALKNFEC